MAPLNFGVFQIRALVSDGASYEISVGVWLGEALKHHRWPPRCPHELLGLSVYGKNDKK